MKSKINNIEIDSLGAGVGAYGTDKPVANVHIKHGATYEKGAKWGSDSYRTFYRITKSSLLRAQRAQYKLITGNDMPVGEVLTSNEQELIARYRKNQAEKIAVAKFRSFAMKLAAVFDEFVSEKQIDVCPESWHSFLETTEIDLDLNKEKSDYLYEVIARILYGSPDRDDYKFVNRHANTD